MFCKIGRTVELTDIELAKENAGRKACEYLDSLDKGSIIGLGTGSTIKRFIDICRDKLVEYTLVSSSPDTSIYARSRRLQPIEHLVADQIELYIDGADEVSNKLDLVKGRGGAMLREKTLAYLSSKRVYIVDYTKLNNSDYLFLRPIPVEVVPFALNYVVKAIVSQGLFDISLRMGSGKDGPVVSDNGNYILDLKPKKPITNPRETHLMLKSIHGIVETGIFPADELVDIVVVGYGDRVVVLERR